MIRQNPKSNDSKFLTSLDLISYCSKASEATHPTNKEKKRTIHIVIRLEMCRNK